MVHPYLFDADTRAVETDWETAAAEWVHPTEILARETVPELWTSYDRVRPRVTTVESDETHGSASISVRALEVLRDEAALLAADGEPWSAISAVGADLRDARPEMAAVSNRINHAMFEASRERTPAAVTRAATKRTEAAVEADSAAARRAATVIDGQAVFTLSRSGTVLQAIEHGDVEDVTVAVSRPGGEGRTVATRLSEAGLDVTLTSDANIPAAVERADVVLVGADSVLPDGSVVNKVGTTAAFIAAERFGTEAFVVCAAAKIRPTAGSDGSEAEIALPVGDPAELADPEAGFAIANPVFEHTPLAPAGGFITERGVLDADEVSAVAQEYAEYASWPEE
jgi:translation initiation factor 2B subunit (eIF-2B alpha/beta/delta family)